MKVIGHRNILKRINHLLDAGTVEHAYLFVGPEHVGKTTIAHAFAAALVSGETMCGELLTHPDIQIIQPEETVKKGGAIYTKDIGVETIRRVIVDAAKTPISGMRRVIIITQAHRMTVSAQNALLKTLEEPAQRTVLMLTATREGALLETVRSRVQKMMLAPVADDIMQDVAQGFFDDGQEISDAVRVAHGCPGILMMCAVDEQVFAWRKRAMRDAGNIAQMTHAEKIAYAQKMAEDTEQAKRIILMWMHLWQRELQKKGARNIAHRLECAQRAYDRIENTNDNIRLVIEEFLFAIV